MITLLTLIFSILVAAVLYVLSFIIFTGCAYVICMCFGLVFSLKYVIGIWLVLAILERAFRRN